MKSVGVPLLIVSLIGLAFALKSWIDLFNQTLKFGRSALPPTRRAIGTIAKSPFMLIPYLALAACVLAAQVLALYLCLISGNLIAALFEKQRRLELEALFQLYGYRSLLPAHFSPLVNINIFSAVYLLLGVFLIGASYAVNSSEYKAYYILGAPGLLIAGYTSILVIVWIFGFALILVFNPSAKAFSDGFKIFAPWGEGFLFGISLFLAFRTAIAGSGLIRRLLGIENG